MIESKPTDIPVENAGPENAEEAVDTLASLLRALGQHGFDTANTSAESARADLEAWARHILVGSDPPGRVAPPERNGARDWKGLCRFASEKRRDEVEYVLKSTFDLRTALWTFVQGMARAVPSDQSSNDSMATQLEKLRTCLNSNDTGEIRRVASASIDALDEEIRMRVERDRRRFEEVAEQVARVSEELTNARENLERDPLTGLFNRAAFDQYFSMMTHLGTLSGQSHTLFLMEVDDFKWLIDRSGPSIGDEVLTELGKTLVEGFGRRGDFVARYDEAEFAVVVQTQNEAVDGQVGEEAVYRVRDLTIPHGDEEIRVTVSIGATRLRCGESREEWLARAERARCVAKEEGRDRIVCENGHREQNSFETTLDRDSIEQEDSN